MYYCLYHTLTFYHTLTSSYLIPYSLTRTHSLTILISPDSNPHPLTLMFTAHIHGGWCSAMLVVYASHSSSQELLHCGRRCSLGAWVDLPLSQSPDVLLELSLGAQCRLDTGEPWMLGGENRKSELSEQSRNPVHEQGASHRSILRQLWYRAGVGMEHSAWFCFHQAKDD